MNIYEDFLTEALRDGDGGPRYILVGPNFIAAHKKRADAGDEVSQIIVGAWMMDSPYVLDATDENNWI